MKKSLAIGFLSCVGLAYAITPLESLDTKFLELNAANLQAHPELQGVVEDVCLYNVDGSFYNFLTI